MWKDLYSVLFLFFYIFCFCFLTCVSPSFFIPVNLIRSFQKYKMIYFVHNYFHLVIFHRLFDHLVQWITLDITKRRYSEHILPVPWPFVIWSRSTVMIHSMNFSMLIKACERQWREDKNHVLHRSPRSILSPNWQKQILNTHCEHKTKEVIFLTENTVNFYLRFPHRY